MAFSAPGNDRPTPLVALAFGAILLAIGCTDAFADLLVTDVKGPVTWARSTQPLNLFDTLKPGNRIAIPDGASVELLDAAAGTVQPVKGPASVVVTPQGANAEAGTLGPVRTLDAALKRVKVNPKDVAVGSLRMRSSESRVVESPDGFVSAAVARTFRWQARAGLVRFELATLEGDPVHTARVEGGAYTLPESVKLDPARTYVWGMSVANPAEAPVDWTEFAIRESAPAPAKGATEWRLSASSLREAGLPRAAARAEQRASAAN